MKKELRIKRGGGEVLGESALQTPLDTDDVDGGLAQMLSQEPTPEFAAQMTEECQRLLDLLEEPALQPVAVAKMEGWTNEEVAVQLGCNLRTVERKLRRIRTIWTHEGDRV